MAENMLMLKNIKPIFSSSRQLYEQTMAGVIRGYDIATDDPYYRKPKIDGAESSTRIKWKFDQNVIDNWDITEQLRDEEEIAAYLKISASEGDQKEILIAIENVNRARKKWGIW